MIIDFDKFKENVGGISQDPVIDALTAACNRLNRKSDEHLIVNMPVAKHIRECLGLLRKNYPDGKIKCELDAMDRYHFSIAVLDLEYSFNAGTIQDFNRIAEISVGISIYAANKDDLTCMLIGFDNALKPR